MSSSTQTTSKEASTPTSKHEKRLAEYLDSYIKTSVSSDDDSNDNDNKNDNDNGNRNCHQQQKSCSFPRVKCCGSSRGLYCDRCHKLLAPKDKWPSDIQNGTLTLPFDLDVVLNDRRRSSSGFHAIVLLGASQSQSQSQRSWEAIDEKKGNVNDDGDDNNNDNDDDKQDHGDKEDDNASCGRKRRRNITHRTVRLIDVKEGDEIPYYNQTDGRRNDQNQDKGIQTSNDDDQIQAQTQTQFRDTTYLLFPSEHSVPISKVVSKIKKLVVLDCKWTNTSIIKKVPQLQHENIKHVHLDEQFVPQESYFWRWHNAGNGMCSTLEAIYFAALEVCTLTKRNNSNDDSNDSHNHWDGDGGGDSDDNDSCNLLSLMWLFAIQRSATIRTAKREGKFNPFSIEGKEYQRSLRRTIKGSDKHIRDTEKGKLLKEIHRIENEKKKQKQVN